MIDSKLEIESETIHECRHLLNKETSEVLEKSVEMHRAKAGLQCMVGIPDRKSVVQSYNRMEDSY